MPDDVGERFTHSPRRRSDLIGTYFGSESAPCSAYSPSPATCHPGWRRRYTASTAWPATRFPRIKPRFTDCQSSCRCESRKRVDGLSRRYVRTPRTIQSRDPSTDDAARARGGAATPSTDDPARARRCRDPPPRNLRVPPCGVAATLAQRRGISTSQPRRRRETASMESPRTAPRRRRDPSPAPRNIQLAPTAAPRPAPHGISAYCPTESPRPGPRVSPPRDPRDASGTAGGPSPRGRRAVVERAEVALALRDMVLQRALLLAQDAALLLGLALADGDLGNDRLHGISACRSTASPRPGPRISPRGTPGTRREPPATLAARSVRIRIKPPAEYPRRSRGGAATRPRTIHV